MGVAHLGVGTIARTKHRELRVRGVSTGDVPAETLQGIVVEEAYLLSMVVGEDIHWRVVDFHDCLACVIGRCCRYIVGAFIVVGTYVASTIAAAEDVVVLLERTSERVAFRKRKERLRASVVLDSIEGSLRLWVGDVADFLGILDVAYHQLVLI